MPFGAQLQDDQHTRFRLWAPSAQAVELVLLDDAPPRILDMKDAGDGWRELTVEANAGARYCYRVNHELEVPDPASRHNPDDVHGASEVIDLSLFDWSGRYSAIADSALHAQWQPADGSSLTVLLNLSGVTLTAPAAPSGKLLYCEPPGASRGFSAGEIPPDAAAVYLSSGPSDR